MQFLDTIKNIFIIIVIPYLITTIKLDFFNTRSKNNYIHLTAHTIKLAFERLCILLIPSVPQVPKLLIRCTKFRSTILMTDWTLNINAVDVPVASHLLLNLRQGHTRLLPKTVEMRALCLILALAVVACRAAPGASNEDDGRIELFSGVAIEK